MASGGGAKVLVIEDDPSISAGLRMNLENEGYVVVVTDDGERGLVAARDPSFDLIVLDVMLPKVNGFDVCRAVRQRGVTTPILMLTARGQVVDKVVGLKLGADDYLTKPFETIELMARLEALLRRRPSSFGSIQSRISKSGCSRWTASTASAPS